MLCVWKFASNKVIKMFYLFHYFFDEKLLFSVLLSAYIENQQKSF